MTCGGAADLRVGCEMSQPERVARGRRQRFLTYFRNWLLTLLSKSEFVKENNSRLKFTHFTFIEQLWALEVLFRIFLLDSYIKVGFLLPHKR